MSVDEQIRIKSVICVVGSIIDQIHFKNIFRIAWQNSEREGVLNESTVPWQCCAVEILTLEGVTEHEFDIYGIFSGVEIWYTLRQTK
jgi:hypothetical protein